jgi:hypothetical protein
LIRTTISDTKSQSESNPQSQPQPQPEPKSQSESNPQSQPQPQPEPKSQIQCQETKTQRTKSEKKQIDNLVTMLQRRKNRMSSDQWHDLHQTISRTVHNHSRLTQKQKAILEEVLTQVK